MGGMSGPPPNFAGPPPNLPPGGPQGSGAGVGGGGGGGGHQHVPKFPPQFPPAGPSLGGTGPPVIGPDGQPVEFDGKRLRKTMMRKTVDYNSSFINMLHNRVWARDYRDRRAVQPDICFYPDIVPPQNLLDSPVNAVTTRFVKTATNKMRCPIFCLSWTPEGRRLITGASSGEFTLWNGLTFNFETILQAHDSPVRTMQWSHNDVWMVTGDHAGYIKYWQSNMNNVKMFQAHKEAIRRVSFCPTDAKFASCSDDGTVRIWDFQRCYEEKVLRGHGADVKCVDWHPHKGIVVSGSKDNQQPIKLWDPKSGQVLTTIHAHKSTVMDCAWNQNGNWLITASRDHLLKLFDLRNLKEEMQTFRGHKKEASAVRWHPIHESMFTSGGSDGSVMFWQVGADKEVGVVETAHESIVWCLAWHPVGHILTTGSNDHTVKFWSRNRPGDSMRDKYNLNTLPPGHEEEYGNLGDAAIEGLVGAKSVEQPSSVTIPGMGPEDKVQSGMTIPGLDFQGPPDLETGRKKQPFSKPIPRSFQNSWNDSNGEPDRGTKRTFGERDGGAHGGPGGQHGGPHGGPFGPQGGGGPGYNMEGDMGGAISRKENVAPTGPGAQPIPLGQLQTAATAIVAKGQIIPVLPGSALFHAIQGGENAVRDVLARDFGIGGQQQGGHQQGQGGHQGPPPGGFQGGGGGGGNFGGGPQGGGGNNYGGPGMGGGPNNFGGMQGGGRDERNFGGNRGDFGGNRRGHWERGGRNRM